MRWETWRAMTMRPYQLDELVSLHEHPAADEDGEKLHEPDPQRHDQPPHHHGVAVQNAIESKT